MEFDEYRKLQEARFLNNTGTTFSEIIFVTQVPFVLNFLSLVGVSAFCKATNPYKIASLQFFFTFIPHIFLLTSFSEHLYIFYAILSSLSCSFLIYAAARINIRQKVNIILKHVIPTDSRLPCITSFRAIVNSFSIICILAADFTCFPEKYLKTNTHGYGLMDTGVGLYVIANALTNSHFNNPKNQMHVPVIPFVRTSFKRILPLLLIGIGRYIATAAINYHQSVSEYGVHWNFFISLSVLAFLNEGLVLFVNRIKTVCFLIAILLPLQEFVLYAGLKSWINGNSPRVGFFSSNREGICSLMGYELIYLCGLVIKYFLPRKGDNCKKYVEVICKFVSTFIIFCILTQIFQHFFEVSRKLANCGYVFWIVSISLLSLSNLIFQELLIYFLNSSMIKVKREVNVVSMILNAINYNGLVFFLIGNLLTGMINISIRTLIVSSYAGIFIIILYMFLCCSLIIYLYQKNIRLR